MIEKAILENPNQTQEQNGGRWSFIGRMRDALKNEAKLTFTLPKPGEGLLYDLGMKGLAAVNISFANLMIRDAGYMQPKGDPNSLPLISDETFLTEVLPASMTALGVVAILLANRNRHASA